MKKKTGLIIALVVVLLAAAGFAGWWFFLREGAGTPKAEGDVYVDRVSVITGSFMGRPEAYAGVVQAPDSSNSYSFLPIFHLESFTISPSYRK